MYVSLQFKLHLEGPQKKKVLELMHKQSSAIRSAYNMLIDNKSHAQIYQRPSLVEGAWNRVRSRLAPLEVGGASLQRDF